MNLDKKVVVTIKNKQVVNNEEENIELITTGKFYKKENAYYVVYDETELSGMEGTTTTVKIGDDEVSLIRFGTTTTKLNFKKGIKDVSLYKTPFGILELVIKPYFLDIAVDDAGGGILLKYSLETGGRQQSNNELLINILESH
jgi:uncharacterized beta-barrel protein YwiB (DUF1934 family)